MLHLSADQKKRQGAHYTPPELADFVARKIVDAFTRFNPIATGSDSISIHDPAVGDGELLESLWHAMPENFLNRARWSACDSDSVAAKNALARLNKIGIQADIQEQDFLDSLHGYQPSLLEASMSSSKFDLIIANPPYVRTQVLGAKKAQALAQKFNLSGRVDLSYPFILGIIESLKPGGIAGIITSNRFLSTKAGQSLRQRLQKDVQVLSVWDLGDTRVFDAAVLPCVLLLSNGNCAEKTEFISVYSVSSKEIKPNLASLFSALSSSATGRIQLGSENAVYEVRRGGLDYKDDIWKLRDAHAMEWIETVKRHTWKTIGDIAKIRVGVKTTADSVFIRDDWQAVCKGRLPENLMPLVTHHLARRFSAPKPSKHILYTHKIYNGRKVPIRLEDYPATCEYLSQHRNRLESRKYVIQAGRKWYEIWVPQEPELWAYPKIVFKDIAEKPTFWLDGGGNVINGDCYWFSFGDQLVDLHWLCLGVFNSSFIEKYYDVNFQNKLYSGRRRFMTQYVRAFPLPDPASDSASEVIKIARMIYDDPEQESCLMQALDDAVFRSFGLSLEEI
jgi:adenine-specific DNA-methyltransferase